MVRPLSSLSGRHCGGGWRNTKSRRESRIRGEGKKVGKKEERDRCGHGTGNKRMVLKSWRRAALSLSLPAQARAGSCYLILLSTLLRFIRQLLGALQYAANGGRIVLRVRSDPAFTLFRLPLPISQPSAPG